MANFHDGYQVQHKKLLILACSAGGLGILFELLQVLRIDCTYAVLVIVHRNGRFHSALEEMAQQRCMLPVKQVEEKESIHPGVVYFAPADYHVLVERNETFSLDASEPVHYCRPSIDVSMQSAAEVFRKKLVAMLLSGANQDGAEGIRAIRKYEGVTIVQDPNDAEVMFMPKAAIATGAVHLVFTNAQLIAYARQLK